MMRTIAHNRRLNGKNQQNSQKRISSKRSNTIIITFKFLCILILILIFVLVIIDAAISKTSSSQHTTLSIPRPADSDMRPSPKVNIDDNGSTAIESYARVTKGAAISFTGSSTCAEAAQSVDVESCIMYNPYVDLRDHYKDEEALRQPYGTVDSTPVIPSFLHAYPIQRHNAILTRCGYKGGDIESQINQDRAVIVSPFLFSVEGEMKATDDISQSHNFFMGIFDGHGEDGHVVAKHSAYSLPLELAKHLELSETHDDAHVQNALVQSFMKVDEDIPQSITQSGCTASVILRLKSKIYVANVGDSLSFIVSYHKKNKTVQIGYMTRKDKPDLEDEQKRIKAAGGRVFIPPKPYPGQTLKLSSRIRVIGLAMSRCIGDRDGKKFGVIAEPIVDVLDINSLKEAAIAQHNNLLRDDYMKVVDNIELFAVSASDGLLDHITPLTVAQFLANSLYQEEGSDAPSAMEACEQLIRQSSEMWMKEGQEYSGDGPGYRDDITLAVTKIKT